MSVSVALSNSWTATGNGPLRAPAANQPLREFVSNSKTDVQKFPFRPAGKLLLEQNVQLGSVRILNLAAGTL